MGLQLRKENNFNKEAQLSVEFFSLEILDFSKFMLYNMNHKQKYYIHETCLYY